MGITDGQSTRSGGKTTSPDCPADLGHVTAERSQGLAVHRPERPATLARQIAETGPSRRIGPAHSPVVRDSVF